MEANRCRGSSLLEIMAFICLMSVFAVISMPALSGTLRRSEIKVTASKIVNWLSGLRQKSINEQIDISVKLAQGTLSATTKKQKGKNFFRNTSRVIPENIHASLSISSIALHATGTQTPASIRLKNSTSACTIRLALRGRITYECE